MNVYKPIKRFKVAGTFTLSHVWLFNYKKIRQMQQVSTLRDHQN